MTILRGKPQLTPKPFVFNKRIHNLRVVLCLEEIELFLYPIQRVDYCELYWSLWRGSL